MHAQQDMRSTVLFSTMNLDMPDFESRTVTIADIQHLPFVAHWNHLRLEDEVHSFRGVVGQDRELIRVGDFVKLTAKYVCTSM